MLRRVKLTSKQEKFVQQILEGKTQHAAYMEAYPNSKKWKLESVKTSASKLLKDEKVSARLNELRKEKERAIIDQRAWDYLESEKALMWVLKKSMQDISENGVRQANSSAIINSVKELNDMMYKLKDYEDYQEFNKLKKDKIESEIKRNNNGNIADVMGVQIIDDIG